MSSNLRIAMLTSDYLTAIGGIASHIAEISKALVKNGHEVEVWFWDTQDRPPAQVEGVPTVLLNPDNGFIGPTGFKMSFPLAKTIHKRIKTFQPDILHAHTLAPISLSLRRLGPSDNYRRILTNHSSGYLSMVRTWFGRQKAKYYCRAIDGVLAPSEELLQKSEIFNLETERYRYISNGVNPNAFQPGDKNNARQKLNLPKDRPILLSTRRFAVKNGLRYLAQALDTIKQKVPEILCIFCGNDSDHIEYDVVKQIIAEKELDNHVRFEGAIPNDQINTYLDACDLMVLPSLMEATSISGLEAMAAAKPIVGTRVGGIPDLIVDNVTGKLVDPADSAQLAQAIINILQQGNLTSMGQAARTRVLENFDWLVIAEKTAAFYQFIQNLPPRKP